MKPFLQIEIDIDTTNDNKPEFVLTPVDVPLNEAQAKAFREAIALGDAFDPHPGDGQLESPEQHIKIPVKVLFVNTKLEADAWVKLRVKNKPV